MSITILFFRPIVVVQVLMFLTVSDSMAAVVGKFIGRHRFLFKILKGSISFYLVSMVIVFIFIPQVGFVAFVFVLIVTVQETLPDWIDDNITVLLCSGLQLEMIL